MSKNNTFLIAFIIISSSVSAAHAQVVKKQASTDKFIYYSKSSIESGSWDIQWNSQYAISGSTVLYFYSPQDGCETSSSGKLLSIVGPYVSFQVKGGGYCEGSAHPFAFQHFKSTDLTTGAELSLLDIFNEEDIFRALLSDGVIRKTLGTEKPENLKQLFNMADGGCDYSINENILKTFTFHHVKNNQVAVRIGVEYGCEVMRGKFTQLGIYLRIPDGLKQHLEGAATSGLLMNEMSKLPYD